MKKMLSEEFKFKFRSLHAFVLGTVFAFEIAICGTTLPGARPCAAQPAVFIFDHSVFLTHTSSFIFFPGKKKGRMTSGKIAPLPDFFKNCNKFGLLPCTSQKVPSPFLGLICCFFQKLKVPSPFGQVVRLNDRRGNFLPADDVTAAGLLCPDMDRN
ncbi:hypothetical protein VPH35_113342 [Triticum aestivum]